MIGQKNLLKILNKYNVETFPHSVILIGESGSGRHTLVNYISENIIRFPIFDITQNISDEYINIIYRNPNPAIYLIDLAIMTEKEQNILLKFVEEPLKNAYVILLCESRNLVLNTIYNRCVPFEMDRYSKEELTEFISEEEDKELILSFLRTPGKILTTNLSDIRAIYDLCDKIVEKINIANFSNTLSIADKINYKDDVGKYDLDLFFDILLDALLSKYKEVKNKKFLNMYLLTADSRKKLLDKRLNKEIFFQNFLTKLWKESRI